MHLATYSGEHTKNMPRSPMLTIADRSPCCQASAEVLKPRGGILFCSTTALDHYLPLRL